MNTRKYTIEHYAINESGRKIKTEPIVVENSLLKAREIGNTLNRENKFISLKNSKGISLPL